MMIRNFLIFGLALISVDPATALRLPSTPTSEDGDSDPEEESVKPLRFFSGTTSSGKPDGIPYVKNWKERQAKAEEIYNGTYRSKILKGCGEICDTSIMGKPGKYFNEIRKSVDCAALFANDESDGGAKIWPPPRSPPVSLMNDYTINGTLEIKGFWAKQHVYDGGDGATPVWTQEQIQGLIDDAKKGNPKATYSASWIYRNNKADLAHRIRNFLQKHRDDIQGKRFFTVGSETPWLEALLLEAGAEHVTTIEYGAIKSEDPRVSTMTPAEVRKLYLNSEEKPQFDGGATFSSVEHAGLGRYGDTLNPWGDLQAMAKAWCITKNGGPMFAGVPTGPDNSEWVYWNAHRVYGPRRWPQLMANFEQQDREPEPDDESRGVMHYFKKLP